jgi:hypothetical protein
MYLIHFEHDSNELHSRFCVQNFKLNSDARMSVNDLPVLE